MGPTPTVAANRRFQLIHPGTPNARILLVTSLALIGLSGAQLALSDKAGGAFLPNLVDVTVILAGLAGFFFAYRHLGRFTIPAEAPREFTHYGSLINSLKYQSIHGKDNIVIQKRGILHFLLYLIPDASLVSMNPRIRNIAIAEAVKGSRFLIATVLILIWAIFAASPATVPYVAVALVYSVFYIWVIWYFRSWGGILTTRHMGSAMIESAGHPQTLFQMLENRVRALHGNAGPIRLLAEPPALQAAGVENTGTFGSYLLYELPPDPVDAGSQARFGTIVSPIACIGLLASVWLLHLGVTQAQKFPFYFCVIAGLWLCGSALVLAWRLDSRFRFVSHVVLIALEGTFFRSQVTVGKSWQDSNESQNTAVRSDIRVNCYGGEVLSEAPGIMDQRELVGMQASARAAELIDQFTSDAETFRQKGVTPIALRFDGVAADINKYNLGVASARTALQGAAGGSARELAPRQAPAEIEPPLRRIEQGEGTKTCPDCAESVKAAARKCRFCGYVFEA